MSTQRYGYQMTSDDPRVWVIDGFECIGWLDLETNEIIRFISEESTNKMLAEVLKRKPPSGGAP